MNNNIILNRLLSYQIRTVDEQQNALKEITQEIALLSLSRARFFEVAAFMGGTCLRILYGLDRFSEDLDFVLDKPDPGFKWDSYIKNMREEFSAYDLKLEVKTGSKLDKSVRDTTLKIDPLAGILILKDPRSNAPLLRIRLEIDTNPPSGSVSELKILDFPLPFRIKAQDLPSLFAGKCHALICRGHLTVRDWYDFVWYIARKTPINFTLLENALFQTGPWEKQSISIKKDWLLQQLNIKIREIDWDEAKQDVSRLLKPRELTTLDLWSEEFFLSRVEKLGSYL